MQGAVCPVDEPLQFVIREPFPPFCYNCTALGEHLNPGRGFNALSPLLAFQSFCALRLVSLAFLSSPPSPTILTSLVHHCLLTLTTLS